MSKPEDYTVDKSQWADGPWQSEPDRVDFEHAGFPCILLRQGHSGHWCGYVGVPPAHPYYQKGYNAPDVDVHGGLTYAEACSGSVCHTPKPGEPDHVWWFGFDCAHCDDRSPNDFFYGWQHGTYKDVAYVTAETKSLAEQLSKPVTRQEAG